MNNVNLPYTIENISQQWNILNNSTIPMENQFANEYLSNFVNSENAYNICIDLYKINSAQEKKLSLFLLYQITLKNVSNLIDDKNLFVLYKNNFFEILSTLNENSENIMIEKICNSISIIILIGLVRYWPESIEDILNFGKRNNFNTYITVTILSDLENELNNLKIEGKLLFKMRNILIEKKELIQNFIEIIINNIEKINEKLFNKCIDLIKSYIQFEFNILNLPKMIELILKNINKSNIDNISELLSECIKSSNDKKEEKEFEEILIQLEDNDYISKNLHFLSIKIIIDFLNEYISNNNENIDIDIKFGLSKISSSILENYIYLLFIKNDISQKLFYIFYFFITNKSLKISCNFFDSINIMKTFINTEYNFCNYNNNEKNQFCEYLIEITKSLIKKCEQKKINENKEILLDGLKIVLNQNDMNNNNNEEIEESEFENNEISVDNYRNFCEDCFFDIFNIFAHIFKENGVNYFLENITKEFIEIVNKNDFNEKNILYLESVIFCVRSTIEVFESLKLNKIQLIQFSLFIIKSQMIKNNFLLINFLLFLERCSIYLSENEENYLEIVNFLLKLLKKTEINNDLRQLVNIILNGLTESCLLFIPQIFEKIFNIYENNFENFDILNITTLVECLCNSVTITVDNNGKNLIKELNNDKLFQYYNIILEIPISKIKNFYENSKNNNNLNLKDENIKYEIKKVYSVFEKIMKHGHNYDDINFQNILFENLFLRIYEYTKYIFNLYFNDFELINEIIKFFIKCTNNIQYEKLLKIFDNLNELMLNSYLKNENNFNSILVIKNIYEIILNNHYNNKYIELITKNFLLLNKEIYQNILKNKNYQIENIENLTDLFNSLFNKLNINYKINENEIIILNTINIFIESIKIILDNKLINKILKSLINFVSFNNKNNDVQIIISKKINDILFILLNNLNKFSSMTINSLSLLIKNLLVFDKNNILINMKKILDTNDLYKIIPNECKLIILQYLEFNYDNEKLIKNIFLDTINIINEMGQIDIFIHYQKEVENKFNKKTNY